MDEKFNKNAKVEQLTNMFLSCGEEKGLIVKDPCLVKVALKSAINTKYVSQLLWRTIRIYSGFMVLVNYMYAVSSRQLSRMLTIFSFQYHYNQAYVFYKKNYYRGKRYYSGQ